MSTTPRAYTSPLSIALLYAGFASLWITTSDWLLNLIIDDPEILARFGAAKGFVFAAITTGLLYLLLKGRREPITGFGFLGQAAEKDMLLRHFYDLPLIGMAFASPATKQMLHVNDQLCSIVGYTRREMMKIVWSDLIHPDNLSAGLAQYQRLLAGDIDGYECDTRLIRKDGAVIDITINMQCVRNPGGTVELTVATIRDITERKSIELALRQSEANLNLAQKIAKIGSWALDVRRNVLTWSEECYRIFGVPVGATLNYELFLECVHPDDRTFLDSEWKAALLGAPYEIEHRIIVNDQVKWIREQAELKFDESGQLIGGIGTAQDITERKIIELKLKESEAILRQSQHIAAIGHYVLDIESGFWTSSELLNKIFGIDVSHTKDLQGWLKLVHPEHRDEMLAYFQNHVLRDLNPFDREYRIVRACDGAIRWLHGLGHLEIGTDGKPRRMLGTIQDITERMEVEAALRESEERLRQAIRVSEIGIFDHDHLSNTIYWSPEQRNIYGMGAQEPITLRLYLDCVHPEDREAISAAVRRAHDPAGDGLYDVEHRIIRSDGDIRWLATRAITIFDNAGNVRQAVRTVGAVLDITDRKINEERLQLAATVFDSSREGIMVVDANERILMVNRAFCELKGYNEDELLGQHPAILLSDHRDSAYDAAMWQSINSLGHWQGEIWHRRKNGEVFPELVGISVVKDHAGKVTHYVGVFTDISRLKATEEKLEFMAHHDPLTQLPNRLLIHSRLQHNLEVARRENRRLALLMLDLDRFKDVNDSFGHLAGDEVLQQVSKRLVSRLRGVDTVARLGGDEFAVLLDNPTHPEDAARVADEIIGMLNEPWRLSNGAEIRIGTSVGISLYPENGQTAEALFQQVDAALYRAKAEGRGRTRYFSDDMTLAARNRVDLETRLRRALTQNELMVYYQPQVDISSGDIIGAEALLRWRNPEKGMIPPSLFIPVAEETGLIAQIGAWVLRETCRQGRLWLDAGLPISTLSVNLSAQQFRYGDIGAMVAQVLAETGFPAERLELELTESVLMEREGEAEAILRRLRDQNVHLAIDDFGTGYSSLAYLKRFPINVLKIDKGFIDDIPRQQDDMAIAAAIVAMAHTLGFKVLAEGVETHEQLAFLRAQGCDRYQGYLTSPAVPAEEFAALLINRPKKIVRTS